MTPFVVEILAGVGFEPATSWLVSRELPTALSRLPTRQAVYCLPNGMAIDSWRPPFSPRIAAAECGRVFKALKGVAAPKPHLAGLRRSACRRRESACSQCRRRTEPVSPGSRNNHCGGPVLPRLVDGSIAFDLALPSWGVATPMTARSVTQRPGVLRPGVIPGHGYSCHLATSPPHPDRELESPWRFV